MCFTVQPCSCYLWEPLWDVLVHKDGGMCTVRASQKCTIRHENDCMKAGGLSHQYRTITDVNITGRERPNSGSCFLTLYRVIANARHMNPHSSSISPQYLCITSQKRYLLTGRADGDFHLKLHFLLSLGLLCFTAGLLQRHSAASEDSLDLQAAATQVAHHIPGQLLVSLDCSSLVTPILSAATGLGWTWDHTHDFSMADAAQTLKKSWISKLKKDTIISYFNHLRYISSTVFSIVAGCSMFELFFKTHYYNKDYDKTKYSLSFNCTWPRLSQAVAHHANSSPAHRWDQVVVAAN